MKRDKDLIEIDRDVERVEIAIRKSERDRIVAWLRREYPNQVRLVGPLADAIERGAHWAIEEPKAKVV